MDTPENTNLEAMWVHSRWSGRKYRSGISFGGP